MEIGDLVWLDPKQFYEYDEHIGIVIEILETPDGKLIKVAWDSTEVGWFHRDELEVINEGW